MNLGYFYSLGYVLSIVFSILWLQSIGKQYPIFMLLLFTSLSAAIVFNLLNFKKLVKTYELIISDFGNWFLMALFLMLTWVFTFLGAIANGMILLTVTFAANAFFAAIYLRDPLKFSCLFLAIAVVFFYNDEPEGTKALSYGILTGLFTFLYFNHSVKFAKKHDADAFQILSIRFYLLILFSFIMLIVNPEHVSISLSIKEVFILLILALFNQILPNFFSQSALLHLGSIKFSFLVTLAPLLAYLGNGFLYNDWTWHMCLLTLLITLALNYDLLLGKVYKL